MLLTRAKTTAGTRAASNVCQFTVLQVNPVCGCFPSRVSRGIRSHTHGQRSRSSELGKPPPAVMWNGWKQSEPPDEIMGRLHPTVTFSARPVVQETPAQPETRCCWVALA